MRILCLTQWFSPEQESSRGLSFAKWLQKRGHDVTVLTGFPNYPGGRLYPGYRLRLRQWDEVEGVRVLRVPLYPNHDRSAFKRSLNYLSFAASATIIGLPSIGQVDVIYAMATPPTVGLPPLLRNMYRGVPYVFNVTDVYPEAVVDSGMLNGSHTKWLFDRLIRSLCRLVYGRATFVTAISNGYKEILVERGLSKERVHAVYNWVDEDLFRPVSPDPSLARQLGLEGRFNLIYAGNLGRFQGLHTVIRAAALIQHIPEIQIVLVGTGQLDAELRSLVVELGLTNVRFVGRIDQQSMPQIYSLADGLLIHLNDLSFLRATVPGKTQISLAAGRPILIAARGESVDIILASRGGLACDPENERALADLIMNFFRIPLADREAMGRRAREYYMQHMSMDSGARKIEALLEQAARLGNHKYESKSLYQDLIAEKK
jgi:glycosyltransferase involved in cell wall biosynthesis